MPFSPAQYLLNRNYSSRSRVNPYQDEEQLEVQQPGPYGLLSPQSNRQAYPQAPLPRQGTGVAQARPVKPQQSVLPGISPMVELARRGAAMNPRMPGPGANPVYNNVTAPDTVLGPNQSLPGVKDAVASVYDPKSWMVHSGMDPVTQRLLGNQPNVGDLTKQYRRSPYDSTGGVGSPLSGMEAQFRQPSQYMAQQNAAMAADEAAYKAGAARIAARDATMPFDMNKARDGMAKISSLYALAKKNGDDSSFPDWVRSLYANNPEYASPEAAELIKQNYGIDPFEPPTNQVANPLSGMLTAKEQSLQRRADREVNRDEFNETRRRAALLSRYGLAAPGELGNRAMQIAAASGSPGATRIETERMREQGLVDRQGMEAAARQRLQELTGQQIIGTQKLAGQQAADLSTQKFELEQQGLDNAFIRQQQIDAIVDPKVRAEEKRKQVEEAVGSLASAISSPEARTPEGMAGLQRVFESMKALGIEDPRIDNMRGLVFGGAQGTSSPQAPSIPTVLSAIGQRGVPNTGDPLEDMTALSQTISQLGPEQIQALGPQGLRQVIEQASATNPSLKSLTDPGRGRQILEHILMLADDAGKERYKYAYSEGMDRIAPGKTIEGVYAQGRDEELARYKPLLDILGVMGVKPSDKQLKYLPPGYSAAGTYGAFPGVAGFMRWSGDKDIEDIRNKAPEFLRPRASAPTAP